jgi:hypothetical protein
MKSRTPTWTNQTPSAPGLRPMRVRLEVVEVSEPGPELLKTHCLSSPKVPTTTRLADVLV